MKFPFQNIISLTAMLKIMYLKPFKKRQEKVALSIPHRVALGLPTPYRRVYMGGRADADVNTQQLT